MVQTNDQVVLSLEAFQILAVGGPLESVLNRAINDGLTNVTFSGDVVQRYWCTNYGKLKRTVGEEFTVLRGGKSVVLSLGEE